MDASVRQLGDLQNELGEIRAAIRAALTGSSYSIGGRTLTRQDLRELRSHETKLVRDIRSLEAVMKGAESPGEAVATWYR